MNRRRLLCSATALSLAAGRRAYAGGIGSPGATPGRRPRPGDPDWPSAKDWARLSEAVDHHLIPLRSPFREYARAVSANSRDQLFEALKNPYFIGDDPALTQSLGWAGAWASEASAFAVAAETTQDVVAAVDFARTHNLRLVVKGGGHSYQGTSNAADSLLIWTRRMNDIVVHGEFVGQGCDDAHPPAPAVTLGAGAIWRQAYDAVTTQAQRYVQGGGCMTVGVAGLIQSGGFGSFSKRYGLAAAGLIEAEIVTADGVPRTVNACQHPDLFWAIKGGGGGTFGVVTRITLRTHDLPDTFGGVTATIHAKSDDAYRRLIGKLVAFYAASLFNPHWGEQLFFLPGNAIWVRMTFQGLSEDGARNVWRPFFEWVSAHPEDFQMAAPNVHALPARHFWDPEILKRIPGDVVSDDRVGASPANIVWSGDVEEVGQYLHGFQSLWLQQSLLKPEQQAGLCAALFEATRTWWISLQVNKGLAGAPPEALAAALDTATNPVVVDSFALAISGSAQQPCYPGIPGHEPDLAAAKVHAAAIDTAMGELRRLTPIQGSYVSESNFFQADWRQAYWGSNYERLLAVKSRYDPAGLFVVHHGVGSDAWSADGFQRLG